MKLFELDLFEQEYKDFTKKDIAAALNFHIESHLYWYDKMGKDVYPSGYPIKSSAIGDSEVDTWNDVMSSVWNYYQQGELTGDDVAEEREELIAPVVNDILGINFDSYVNKLERRLQIGRRRRGE
ncbi:hypothetical protein LCGC14_0919180 [marine sediment metagenome]|uniref:Uncharacterized protein n=1 Tax=marine sediment metagenome TaxID=412755 RepID=A0A0F9RA14_9ZZZZ